MILGRPGEGKTALAAWLLRGWPANFVWVYDSNGDPLFGRYKKCWIEKPPPKKNCLVFIDEAEELAPSAKYEAEWVKTLIKKGRNNNASWICATKRPQEMRREIMSYCETAYIFQLTGSLEMDYILKEWGPRCQAVRHLQQHEFVRLYPRDFYKPVTIHKLNPEIIKSL